MPKCFTHFLKSALRGGVALVLVTGCSLHPKPKGNAEGFGGGGPTYGLLESSRTQLVRALTKINEQYDLDTIAKWRPCDPAEDPAVCRTVNALSQAQIAQVQQFIVGAADALLALNVSDHPVTFEVSTDPIQVVFPDGQMQTVDAKTPYGPTGTIVFNEDQVLALSPSALLALLGHEMGHKISPPEGGPYITDNDPIGAFASSGGGRLFLDAVGAALARYAAHISRPANVVRAGAVVAWTGNLGDRTCQDQMLVWGGNNSVSSLASGLIYKPATNSYQPMKLSPLAARTHPISVWTGSEMIVWGGIDGQRVFDDGAIYSPCSQTWRPMSLTGAPDKRSYFAPPNSQADHSPLAVWTGSSMIVWGGFNVTESGAKILLNSGAIYQPSTDTWTSMSLVGAPSARTGNTVAWTGELFLVWGGLDASGTLLNDGYSYNPQNGTWASLAQTNPPEARRHAASVWTGNRLIVWGGYYASNTKVNEGAAFDLATGIWTPIAATPEIYRNKNMTTVWTGTQMIVWGGHDGSDFFNTGAIYTPATDSWVSMGTELSGSGAPVEARARHTGIWTGHSADPAIANRFVLYGGYRINPYTDTNLFLRSGAIYNPATDLWTATQ